MKDLSYLYSESSLPLLASMCIGIALGALLYSLLLELSLSSLMPYSLLLSTLVSTALFKVFDARGISEKAAIIATIAAVSNTLSLLLIYLGIV